MSEAVHKHKKAFVQVMKMTVSRYGDSFAWSFMQVLSGVMQHIQSQICTRQVAYQERFIKAVLSTSLCAIEAGDSH